VFERVNVVFVRDEENPCVYRGEYDLPLTAFMSKGIKSGLTIYRDPGIRIVCVLGEHVMRSEDGSMPPPRAFFEPEADPKRTRFFK
jgi:hypothetical protein